MELVQKSDRYYAGMVTIVFHVLLLLLFLLYKIITPLPPYNPEGGGGLGVELNFGDSEMGMGMVNPDELSAPVPPAPVPPQENAPLLTSEEEEEGITEPVKEKVKPKKEVKELKRPEPSPKITRTEAEPVKNERLYSGKKGGSEGNTGKAGNQGQQEGDPFGPVFKGKKGEGGGSGGGTGSGTGSGNGSGNGPGNGPGGGMSFSLGGRGSITLPKPAYTSEKSGRVVVDITVDQEGRVVKARAGARGTTVQDSELFRQAESAAKKARFKPAPDAPEMQVGTITYNFIRD
jgi:TonB family protein